MGDEADRIIDEGMSPDDLDPMYDPDAHREHTLVGWFKETFEARTPPKRIDEILPDSRISWHEISAQMKELGFGLAVVDARFRWDEIFQEHKLRAWCNKLLKNSRDSRRL